MDEDQYNSKEFELKVDKILGDIKNEYMGAKLKGYCILSPHEGYAVIKEELDELWDEIKLRQPINKRLKDEAIQIGAMALAFVIELGLEG